VSTSDLTPPLSFQPDQGAPRLSISVAATTPHAAPARSSKFGTKAETLEFLRERVQRATVLDQIRFTVSEWRLAREKVFQSLKEKQWLETPLIVRSSAQAEDLDSASMAGHFQSVLNVKGNNAVKEAVEKVISSYGDSTFDEQILVQPMLQDVAFGGVAFSIDPNSGSPYRVINLSENSTTAITSGNSNAARTFFGLRNSDCSDLPDAVQTVIKLIDELETILDHDRLDIEFAVDLFGQVYLLQCRPLIYKDAVPTPEQLQISLDKIAEKMRSLNKPHPYLLGSRTIFAVMPDWNPAEIIGIRPKPLALSLYKELITDNIWAYQRSNFGYRNMRSFPLIVNFCGLPYVDVRVDFNSFLPADIGAELGDRLVNYYLDLLLANPANHDKVEFEIVQTCYTFDMPDKMERLRKAGFSQEDCDVFSRSLCNLTNGIIHAENGLWKTDVAKIETLKERIKTISNADLDAVSKIYWLLEDCKRYGTLPFAGLARAGFIAVELLKSLVTVGIFSKNDYDNFMASVDSVSSCMTRDFQNLSRAAFLQEYGHLRPGTYDILSPRYDEEPDRYFDWSKQAGEAPGAKKDFNLSLVQLRKINKLLVEHNLGDDVLGFFDFIRAAIEGREFAKFVFTKSLSDALSILKDLGANHGFSAEDCSFTNIDCIKELYGSSNDIRDVIEHNIAKGRKDYEVACRLRLPSVISKESDIWSFEVLATEPNFITQNKTVGKVVFSTADTSELRDSILFIPSADPGFDWIFSHDIKGLVTMYGGVNSHMAIRSGELGIPAVIGAGELLYGEWSQASILEIDCANCQVLRIK